MAGPKVHTYSNMKKINSVHNNPEDIGFTCETILFINIHGKVIYIQFLY